MPHARRQSPHILRCRALLFDMDGVLVDSRAVVERICRRWAARRSLDPEAVLRVAHGRRTRDTVRLVAPHLSVPEEVAWLDTAEEEDLEGIVQVPGARELVGLLPPARWAIVTSAGSALARRRLERAGVPIPPILVSSGEVALGKPAPDGYTLAARLLGVHSGNCVVFEDALPGIAAGRAAGAAVVGVGTMLPPQELHEADVIIHDLHDVRCSESGQDLVLEFSAQRGQNGLTW
ncbi:MAG TPA: HAD-IA family hydrolase [Gemmatimonadaceae bacterium]|nr:HAD-IA family hydrolase [Gemmatimonadaceae bacterium]